MGASWAAATVAAADTLIGLVLIFIARRAGPTPNEEKLAREIREMDYTELNKDAQQIKGEFDTIAADITRIRKTVGSFTSSAAGALGPILGLLAKSLKRD